MSKHNADWKEYMKRKLRMGFEDYEIPEHMRQSLIYYVLEGLEPGSFMSAVLSNDLAESVGRADHINREKLFNYVQFIYNVMPSESWGSSEKIFSWCAWRNQENGLVEEN